MSHSLGPWRIKNFTIFGAELGKPIAKVYPQQNKSEELANSRLMESAPEMFEELKFLIDECIELKELEYSDGSTYEVEVIRASEFMVERIRKIIAKVTGGEEKLEREAGTRHKDPMRLAKEHDELEMSNEENT